MIHQGREIPNNTAIECDICIAGSGAAGLTLAIELASKNYKVVVLEAGDEGVTKESQAYYDGTATDLPYSIPYSRLRALGGTTQHWAGFCAPLDAEDFEKRDHVEHSGWPISRADLDPYYQRASEHLKLGEYDPSPGAWANDDKNTASFSSANGFTDKIWHYNRPMRFGDEFKDTLKQSKAIDLYLNSPLVDLVFQDNSDVIESATVQSENSRFHIKAKQFVLACGGIECPRLLLNFNKQRPMGIGNDHDYVGRFFQEHPEFHSLGRILLTGPDAKTKLYLGHHRKPGTYGAAYFQINKELRSEKHLLNSAFHLTNRKFENSAIGKDIQDFTNRLYGHTRDPDAVSHFQCIFEQEPDFNRRVTLSDKKDELGLFKPNINVGLTELDLASIQNTFKTFTSLIARYKIGRVKFKNPELLHSKDSIKELMGWGNHHMGATRMSEDPKRGVVDKNCKVHSVENLYVSSSSVFTTSGCSNPTFTIVALAFRLAEHINNKLQ